MENVSEKKKWLNLKNVIIVLMGVIIMVLFVNSVVNKRLQTAEAGLRTQIAEQQALLATIAETTARNGADAVTESIVKDCGINERSRFEELLNSLGNNLSRTELVEAERLFGRCGSFYSERKSVMVSRLAREIEVYTILVNQLSTLTNQDQDEEYKLEQWKNLSNFELDQSKAFAQLVVLQDKIITTLLDGKSAQSPEMLEILSEVNETQENLLYANNQAASTRGSLISL